jgi:hypothetical protein
MHLHFTAVSNLQPPNKKCMPNSEFMYVPHSTIRHQSSRVLCQTGNTVLVYILFGATRLRHAIGMLQKSVRIGWNIHISPAIPCVRLIFTELMNFYFFTAGVRQPPAWSGTLAVRTRVISAAGIICLLSLNNSHHSKNAVFFLRYVCYVMTLSIPTCFSPMQYYLLLVP